MGIAQIPAPTCPPKAAQSFVSAHAAMTRVGLGCHFNALIEAWTRVEAASKFEQGVTNLPSKGRPPQVGTWIASARATRGGSQPTVSDPAAYARQWQAWWDSLQPEWRKKDADGTWSVEGYGGNGNEWGPLTQWGVNGTLSVVASLYFWGCTVHEDLDFEPRWEAAVLDATWALEGLATFFEKFNRKF
ncbi:hypothetical protein DFH07DRAFT_738097 [Mycena maculata]|uniref:Uncharacterized protein n=1 Tax=Mycena maculata TaxID=230809 RepID=A0AAD7JLF2_9AGAR|nr:hypothetical protein DFH07DRAFT_738097 [Mycena maculata]